MLIIILVSIISFATTTALSPIPPGQWSRLDLQIYDVALVQCDGGTIYTALSMEEHGEMIRVECHPKEFPGQIMHTLFLPLVIRSQQ